MFVRARYSAAVLALAGATALAACSPGGGATSDPNNSAAQGADGECSNLQQVARWELDRRLGQLLMGGAYADNGEPAITATVKAVASGKVGGVNLLGSSSYAYSNNELAQAVDAGGQVPPFLAVDEEGGRVQRLSEEVGYVPSAREMAATMTPKQVQDKAQDIGRTMQKLSLNMDLAPVVDVSSQDDYAVVGDRSFSDDPETVTEYAGAFANGLRAADVIPVLKHFPGLGSGTGNTDFEEARTPPLKKLKKYDLKPYESLLLDTPVAVMTTNAVVPGLSDGEPASLAPATYQLLRQDYGFDGVIMTDSLSAAAVLAGRDIKQAATQAIIAGADIALWDELGNAGKIHRALRAAVESGKLPEEQVNQSVTRVLDLKGVDLCEGR